MCCGSGQGPKKIRSTYSSSGGGRQTKDTARSQKAPKAVPAQRMKSSGKKNCDKCGAVALLVYISNRERFQCSNDKCRNIIK